MRVAILSDIHGNLEALEAVIASCREEGVRAYCCAGDVIGYGADPQACIERLIDLKTLCVAGNHDWALLNKMDTSRFNPMAVAAIQWSREHLDKNAINWLNGLELIQNTDDFTLVHGSLNSPQYFKYIKDIEQALDTFFLMKMPLCFIGHTHRPQVLGQKGGTVHYYDEDRTDLENNVKYIVNVGSVGQPRDGDPQAAYCIYDPDLKRIEIKRVDYDIAQAQSKIISAGLPEQLAYRLAVGQ